MPSRLCQLTFLCTKLHLDFPCVCARLFLGSGTAGPDGFLPCGTLRTMGGDHFMAAQQKGQRMVSFTIHNIGTFMAKLFSTDSFDSFLLKEAVIRMAVTYSIDGQLNKDFYENDVADGEGDPGHRFFSYQPWSEARLLCREIIKGKKAPSFLRLTLLLKPQYVFPTLQKADDLPRSTMENVAALILNVRLDDTGLHLITGVAVKTFLPDKTPDRIWDHTMERFLAAKEIAFVAE